MKKFSIVLIAAVLSTFFIMSCTSRKKDAEAAAVQVQDTLGLAEYQKWKMESEIREKIEAEKELENNAVAASAATRRSSAASSSRSGNRVYRSSGSSSGTSNSSGSGTASAPAPAPQRKGMSHTAKGAIVGAASGAVIGAVANKKNRLGGGVVGGVIGAATGAGVGAIVDKKERQRNGY